MAKKTSKQMMALTLDLLAGIDDVFFGEEQWMELCASTMAGTPTSSRDMTGITPDAILRNPRGKELVRALLQKVIDGARVGGYCEDDFEYDDSEDGERE